MLTELLSDLVRRYVRKQSDFTLWVDVQEPEDNDGPQQPPLGIPGRIGSLLGKHSWHSLTLLIWLQLISEHLILCHTQTEQGTGVCCFYMQVCGVHTEIAPCPLTPWHFKWTLGQRGAQSYFRGWDEPSDH